MIRAHFTAEDLLRTRFVSQPAPLVELGMAFATLQQPGDELVFSGWRDTVRRSLPDAARPVFGLVPPNGAGPMFLDPVSDGLDDGLDLVQSASNEFVLAELQRVCPADRPLTPWVRGLVERDHDAWQSLIGAVRAGHVAVLERDWPRVCAALRVDLAFRGRVLAEQGLRACLAGVYHGAQWHGSVLHIPALSDRDVYLDGNGATMYPSAYWTAHPLVGWNPDGSGLFLYPALTALPLIEASPSGDPLAALLGHTRAAVLRTLVDDHSTSSLAAKIGISVAAASEHAKTLRRNGLVQTERAGKAVLHSTSSLGMRLLAGPLDIEPRDAGLEPP